jgi:hypothetical protein
MRIFEIITPTTVVKQQNKPFDMDKLNKAAEKHWSKDDASVFSKGKQDPKDPFMFNKTSLLPSNLKDDAYYNYIKAAKPYMKRNPYFPRVYDITLTKDSEGRIIPKYSIEKLIDAEIGIVGGAEGNLPYNETNKAMLEKLFVNPPKGGHVEDHLNKALKQNDFSNIKDELLINALTLITKVKESNPKFNYDLHGSNTRYRLGPTGPQLVLMDPLS